MAARDDPNEVFGGLSADQFEAASMIAHGSTFKSVRERFGIGDTRLRQWRALPQFQALMTDAQGEMKEMLAGRLYVYAVECLNIAVGIARDETVQPHTRAATSVALAKIGIQQLPAEQATRIHITFGEDDPPPPPRELPPPPIIDARTDDDE